jgi:hypothetical protein
MSPETKTNSASSRVAWNRGASLAKSAPFGQKKVWAIRVRLQMKRRKRDVELFDLSIDTKLDGCVSSAFESTTSLVAAV